MKSQILLFIIFLVIPISSYSLNASKFFNALETNNGEHALRKIHWSSNISPKEIVEFFQDIKEICEILYGISISLLQVQQDILDVCRENISNTDYLFQIEVFLNELLDPENITTSSQRVLLTSHKKYKSSFEYKDIPLGILIGCVEIGCGSLLWITPFRTIGSFLICDGCRRMFHETVEKARNSNHNMF